MSKNKFVESLEKVTVGVMSPAVLEKVAQTVNSEVAKRKNYIKIPNVKGLSPQEAGKILESYGFEYSSSLTVPGSRLANKKADQIITIRPHSGLVVSPDTHIKLYYADEQIIERSKEIEVEEEEAKQRHHQQREAVAKEVNGFSKKILKKLPFKK
ncbi:PASTA domain-containing protein [Convivina intestini]|uniref:PASTA domain-containing protein n=1 Tax=Convivina intestini TaxID=1505726 RepID=UPI00200D4383|nr:PASTA domain-containing protein [Convivina intestini]CAH1853977.1 hypothetical protein R078131_00890 [Convivina intestini]